MWPVLLHVIWIILNFLFHYKLLPCNRLVSKKLHYLLHQFELSYSACSHKIFIKLFTLYQTQKYLVWLFEVFVGFRYSVTRDRSDTFVLSNCHANLLISRVWRLVPLKKDHVNKHNERVWEYNYNDKRGRRYILPIRVACRVQAGYPHCRHVWVISTSPHLYPHNESSQALRHCTTSLIYDPFASFQMYLCVKLYLQINHDCYKYINTKLFYNFGRVQAAS